MTRQKPLLQLICKDLYEKQEHVPSWIFQRGHFGGGIEGRSHQKPPEATGAGTSQWRRFCFDAECWLLCNQPLEVISQSLHNQSFLLSRTYGTGSAPCSDRGTSACWHMSSTPLLTPYASLVLEGGLLKLKSVYSCSVCHMTHRPNVKEPQTTFHHHVNSTVTTFGFTKHDLWSAGSPSAARLNTPPRSLHLLVLHRLFVVFVPKQS